MQAERRYCAAAAAKSGAPQPHQGLLQLYKRTKDANNIAATAATLLGLPSVIAQGPTAVDGLRQARAQALLDAGRPADAAAVVAALVSDFHARNSGRQQSSPAGAEATADTQDEGQQDGEEEADLPPELVILQADAQLALDEIEFERRLQARLTEPTASAAGIEGNSGGLAGAATEKRTAALAAEVGAGWVRSCRAWH